ncbi:MAG: LexA family transcriptional regulator [Gammaproteobacteria bacterium]|nr:LexA family transcriptional regulator [Gammaproteobacteria bacterium]
MTRDIDRIRLKNLGRLVAEAGSLSELARRAGVSGSNLSHVRAGTPYATGTPRHMGDSLAAKLERAMGKPPGWMNEEQPDEVGPFPPGTGHPVLSWVQAGTWTEARELPASAERLQCPQPCGPGTFVLKVAGESMAPRFPDGEFIFVDPDLPAEHGSYVVVRRADDGAATFKQLVVERGRRFLKAANPLWSEPIVEAEADTAVCGVVFFQARPV